MIDLRKTTAIKGTLSAALLTLTVVPMHAEINFRTPQIRSEPRTTYSHPEPERQVQPQRQQEPVEQRRSTVEPETRRESFTPPQQEHTVNAIQRPEYHPNNNVRAGEMNLGANHSNVTVVRPEVVTPVMRRAMAYNTRPGGVHINPEYFASHYGLAHGFHFVRYTGGPCIGDCGLTLFGGEWYFSWNGGWFGLTAPMPAYWGFQTDCLYIDIGDDGNYYLYDAKYPDTAVQLTFVQNVGDDQAGVDQ